MLVLLLLSNSVFAIGTGVFINEIHYNNVGADVGEAVEIAGPIGTDLGGWSLVAYNGSGGSSYSTTLLSGAIRVATFNLLNYFNGDGLGGGFPTSRGADTLADFNRQRDKILVALLASHVDEFAYNYLFDAQLGNLDYALTSLTLTGQVTGATAWHVNADEPDLLNYDTTFKLLAQQAIYAPDAYRSSDHDAVIVGLDLAPCPDLIFRNRFESE